LRAQAQLKINSNNFIENYKANKKNKDFFSRGLPGRGTFVLGIGGGAAF